MLLVAMLKDPFLKVVPGFDKLDVVKLAAKLDLFQKKFEDLFKEYGSGASEYIFGNHALSSWESDKISLWVH